MKKYVKIKISIEEENISETKLQSLIKKLDDVCCDSEFDWELSVERFEFVTTRKENAVMS